MFYPIFLAILLALACPSHKHSASGHRSSNTTVMSADSLGDGDGENGHIPPR